MNQSNSKAQQPAKVVVISNNKNKSRPKRKNSSKTITNRSVGKSVPSFSKVVKPFGGSLPQRSSAVAYSSGQRSKAPKISSTRDQSHIIHRELLASITGSTNFSVPITIPLNPGLPASFPWLSTQAQGWERYRFNSLKFCYYTRTGSNVPGSVMLIPDYDAADPAPVSEQIASTYEDVEEDAPWLDIECELRPSALNGIGPSKFIRTGALLANQDIKTYDAGNFFLGTTDGTAVNWGKLWVEYDIVLMTPQLPPGGAGVIASQAINSVNPTSAAILPTPISVANSSSIVSVNGEVLTFLQAGQFYITYDVQATTATSTSNPSPSGAALILLNTFGSGTASMLQQMQLVATVGETLTFNNTLVTGTNAQLVINQIPSLLGAI